MTAKVILNPYANRWRSQARWPEAEAALRAAGIAFDLAISQHKGQVTDLVKQAARQGYSPIIVVGGDGTIGDAVNGLARAAASPDQPLGPLGILPTGSANDLVDNLGLPKDLHEAARVIRVGKTRAIDLCKLNDRYFANNSAAGLEPYVTLKHEAIHHIKGVTRYLLAAIQAILDRPEWYGHLCWDGGEYEGPLTLISVGNGPRTGGLFYMTPHAQLDDGKLTVAFGYRPTRRQMFQTLPRTMKPGKGNYVEMEGIHEFHCTHLTIHLDHPSPAHTDGELLPHFIQDFEYSIQPGRLKIFTP